MPLLEVLASAAILAAYIKFSPRLRRLEAGLPAIQSLDGNWMWITLDGAVYEDVGTFFVRAETVTFRHKHGTARLRISDLNAESRAQLIRRYQENHSLSILPLENDLREVRAFETEAA